MKHFYILAIVMSVPVFVPGAPSHERIVADSSLVTSQVGSSPISLDEQPLGEQVREFFSSLLNTSNWPPRWESGTWSPFHAWLYIASDMIIWMSFLTIPVILAFLIFRKRTEAWPFQSVMFLFITFILACGVTHLMDAAIFWWPAYRLSALLKTIAALACLATVFALIRIVPKVIKLKSPATLQTMVETRMSELEQLNARFQEEITQRERAEKRLQTLYTELELRTKDLESRNNELLKREHDLLKSEEKVRRLNSNLEKAIEERTIELNATNRELEAFTYSVSHDLRAPLRAINGYARILEEDFQSRIGSQGKHLIGVITKNARYMGQLIDDLLEFSRTSRAEVRQATFNTDEEVRKICADALEAEPNRQVEIDIKLLSSCNGDITMLRQIWVNLISNAFKYTRKVPVAKIEIGSFHKDQRIVYYIKDNGVGFDMGYKEKLFGVFQRLHRKEEFEGTGVGLALVKRILDRHQGLIWAESTVNSGAQFFFSLPA
jgi:signal transduction histidine kinase